MINPKLIEVFGEQSRGLFAGIIAIIGEKDAVNYYVNVNIFATENKIPMPRYMSSTSDKINEVGGRVCDFIYDFTGNDDATGIHIFNRKPEDDEVQLCIN